MIALQTNMTSFRRAVEFRTDRHRHEARLRDEAYCRDVPATERARERGSADRYYGRPFKPVVRIGALAQTRPAYTPRELTAYVEGWHTETDRKEW